jgi:aminoglycoside phosphotransferase (APT) family kinase protein
MNTNTPLFQPNNHSVWKVEYEPTPQDLVSLLAEVLKKYYHHLFDDILSIEQNAGANVNNTNFRVTVRTQNGDKKFLLRKVGSNDLDALKLKNTIASMLATYDVKVPRIQSSAQEDSMVAEGGSNYMVYDFFTADHYRGAYDELMDVAREIGKFDHATKLVGDNLPQVAMLRFSDTQNTRRAFSRQIWEDIFHKVEQMVKRGGDTAFPTRLLAEREHIMATLAMLESMPKVDDVLGLVHIDLHPHNILTDGTHLVAILDLDSLRYVEKMRGFAFAIHRLVRQHIVFTKPDEIDKAVARARAGFLAAYQEQNPLSVDDITRIPYFIQHEALSRLTDSTKAYANTGVLLWKHDLEKQLATIAESQFF